MNEDEDYNGPPCDCGTNCGICPCGKPMCKFDTCPICGEKTCFDCDDWEKHHENDTPPYGEEDITSPS